MITSQTSHDYTLVDQLNSITTTQPVDAHTNESNIENKICNIKTKVSHLIGNIPCDSYKRTKAAVKYTCETIDAHPGIAASILIVALIPAVALLIYNGTLCITQKEISPVMALSSIVVTVIINMIAVALSAYNYKKQTNRKASLPVMVLSMIFVGFTLATLIAAVVAPIAFASFPPYYHEKWC